MGHRPSLTPAGLPYLNSAATAADIPPMHPLKTLDLEGPLVRGSRFCTVTPPP